MLVLGVSDEDERGSHCEQGDAEENPSLPVESLQDVVVRRSRSGSPLHDEKVEEKLGGSDVEVFEKGQSLQNVGSDHPYFVFKHLYMSNVYTYSIFCPIS